MEWRATLVLKTQTMRLCMYRHSLLLVALLALFFAVPASAEDYVPDDVIQLDLSVEGFVTTQTANITATVDAAITDDKAASARAEMQKAVTNLAKPAIGEWRLVGFNRSQDQTGLTRWQATYEARVAEAALAGINERAQKLSKAGMQIRIMNTDFTPTLAESEAKRAELRIELYKRAQEELARINAQFPNRGYRLMAVDFSGGGMAMPFARPMMIKAARMEAMAMNMDAGAGGAAPASAEVAQRLTLTAMVTFGARPAVTKP